MLQRDGHPTALGEAIAAYGRIFKSLHILAYIDTDETYRRDIKGIRNLQEGRHALARKICHGKKGELYHRYERGLENQLGALGLVLNCVVLWTTVYLDAAVRQLISALPQQPVIDVAVAQTLTGKSHVTAGKALQELELAGILQRLNERKWGRVWECDQLLNLVDEFEKSVLVPAR